MADNLADKSVIFSSKSMVELNKNEYSGSFDGYHLRLQVQITVFMFGNYGYLKANNHVKVFYPPFQAESR